MAININKAFSKFGKGIKSKFEKFGKTALGDVKEVGSFIKNKALPAVEKVAGQIGKGIQYATPVLTALAPELLPFAMGASKVAGLIGKGTQIAKKGITSGEAIVSSLKKGDQAGATQAGADLRGNITSLSQLRM